VRYWVFLGFAVVSLSCSQRYYRQSADRETYPIVEGRVTSPLAAVGRTQVEPDPTSRLVDPTDPDRPPKPPDDPAAALYMANPGKFSGAKGWEKDGVVDRIEPINWALAQGIDPNGTLKLTQDRAVEIALINSRDYQTNLENVYLTALSLTLNRFEFDTRWFGRNNTSYNRVGSGTTDHIASNSNLGFNRNLAAGGQILVDFANSYVWEFTGSSSRLSGNYGISLVQPLLRNFGRKVRLESLTQAERDTLYVVRDYARFRKQFWSSIAVDSGGYLSLLLLQQGVRNARANLKSQEENYKLSLELLKGNKKSPVEVDTIFQGLLSARQSIINAEIGLQEALDAFKLQLGLPPTMAIELDDTFLNQFVLVDPVLEKLQDELTVFSRERNAELGAAPSRDNLVKNYIQLRDLAKRVTPALEMAERDMVKWKADLDRPMTANDDAEQRERTSSAFRQQTEALEPQRKLLAELIARLTLEADRLTETKREAGWKTLTQETVKLTGILDTAVAAQTQARIYLIRLPEVSVEETSAIAEAKENRLDLQNRQAQVTDSWRKVTVAANQLQADFNIVANANLISDPNSTNPFNISNDLSRFSVGFQFDGPLNRVAERNAYRASLINFQRSRRNYMQLSDQIEQQIRSNIRSLRLQRVSFEIARQSLIAAARQLENEQLLLSAPVQAAGGSAGDATLRKLRALDQLLSARDQLAGSFIRYEQQRIRLLLDLEALQLDSRGFPSNASPTNTQHAAIDR
jgi:outer membrane protein TolC